MKKKLVILFSVIILLAALAATPAFALPMLNIPTETPFSMTVVQVPVSPGTTYTWIGTIQVTTNYVTNAYSFGSPWGSSTSGTITGVRVIDTSTNRGSGQVWPVLNFAKGTLNRLGGVTMDGVGSYTYMGPTFVFTLVGSSGTVSGTITNGAIYSGVLFHGNAVGTGSNGLNVLESDTFTGVSITSGPLTGVTVSYHTGYIQS